MTLEEIMRRRANGESDESIVQILKKEQRSFIYTPEQMAIIQERAEKLSAQLISDKISGNIRTRYINRHTRRN
jgi:hypothetical protein